MATFKITCCKDCATRHPGCHASCEKYIQQKAELDEFKEEQRIQHEINLGLNAFRYDGINRVCKQRNYREKYRRGH